MMALAADRVLEPAQAFAQRAPDLRQPLRAENQEDHDKEDDDVEGILKAHAVRIAQLVLAGRAWARERNT